MYCIYMSQVQIPALGTGRGPNIIRSNLMKYIHISNINDDNLKVRSII